MMRRREFLRAGALTGASLATSAFPAARGLAAGGSVTSLNAELETLAERVRVAADRSDSWSVRSKPLHELHRADEHERQRALGIRLLAER